VRALGVGSGDESARPLPDLFVSLANVRIAQQHLRPADRGPSRGLDRRRRHRGLCRRGADDGSAELTLATSVLFALLRTGMALTPGECLALLLLYLVFIGWIGLETAGVAGLLVV